MNIEACHISVEGLRVTEEIRNILDKFNIKTYADLEECIKNNSEISNNYFFLSKAYFDFKKNFINQLSIEKIYEEYSEVISKNKLLNITNKDIDRMVKVVDLPLYVSNPQTIYSVIYGRYKDNRYKENIEKISVDYLKNKINEWTFKNGEMHRNILYYGTGIGEVKYSRLIATLEFYDKYIEILLKEYSNKENPFYYMQEEKIRIVKETRDEIFNYLCSVGYELIFGNVETIMKLINQKHTSIALKKINMIENVIANYVTYDEALNITSPKVLNRFIIPYGKK